MVLVGVYTDMITVSLVKREGGNVAVTAVAMEPQEGESASGGVLDVERIVLNCRKALAALPHDAQSAQEVVFALGGGMGAFSFIHAKEVREAKEKRISTEDIRILIEAHAKGNDTEVSRSFAESFSIDGFVIADPVGLNGGEILVGIAREACSDALAQGLSQATAGAGLLVKGFCDMRYAAAKHIKFCEGGRESAMVLCVFEQETTVVCVRNRAVTGVGVTPVGYGILCDTIAKTFFVGCEEAKKIMSAFANKELDAHVHERVGGVCAAAGATLITGITNAIARFDATSLLPGNIWVVSSKDVPQIDEALCSPGWLASLPIERNAAVRVWRADAHKGFLTPFDGIIAELL